MGCGASTEAASPLEKPAPEKNTTADREPPAAEASDPPLSARGIASEKVPESVKSSTASTAGLLERGYDQQFIHPLNGPMVPWTQQLDNSASNN